jgi:transposase
MPRLYHLSQEQKTEIQGARKNNKDKNIEKRLKALELRAEGNSAKTIAEKAGFAESYVYELVSKYINQGLGTIVGNNYKGNNRNMSFEKEEAFLDKYRTQAELGQVIDVGEIKKAYEEAVGHKIGGSQIYYVLSRHGWRKLMPRSKHPNKASEETINVSKKLTMSSKVNW